MNRYRITSPKFSGEIQLLYSPGGRLLCMDFMKADLTETQLDYFKRRCPVQYTDESFREAFATSNLTLVGERYHVSFDQFWDAYDQKHNRERCLKLWNKLPEPEKVKAFHGLTAYTHHLALNAWKSKADPDTYLRKYYWNNEWK